MSRILRGVTTQGQSLGKGQGQNDYLQLDLGSNILYSRNYIEPSKTKNGDPKAGCEQNVMDADIEWCGALNYSMSSCVGWIREELEYYCSNPYYSCIISNASSWSSWRTWQAQG